jgi:hypothetical protein
VSGAESISIGALDSRACPARADTTGGRRRRKLSPAGDEGRPSEMANKLENEFHDAMIETYRRAKIEARYTAGRFHAMIGERGGLETARHLLHADTVSDGYTALWERGRLDLSVERVILEPKWEPLFTLEERKIAVDRLRKYEFAGTLPDLEAEGTHSTAGANSPRTPDQPTVPEEAANSPAKTSAQPLTATQLADWRRQLLRLLDAVDPPGDRPQGEGLAGRIARLSRAGTIPRHIAAYMKTISETRNVTEYEGAELSVAQSAAVEASWEAVKEWAAKRDR